MHGRNPTVKFAKKKYATPDMVFLALVTNERITLLPFLNKTTFNYTVFPDTRSIAESYGVVDYSTYTVVDKNGNVKLVKVGGDAQIGALLTAAVDTLESADDKLSASMITINQCLMGRR